MNRLKGVLYGIISSSTFGLIPFFALPALNSGVGVDSVMFYRFSFSTLAMGLWLLLKGTDLRISVREFITVFVLGAFYALTSIFLTQSYLYIPSGIATTIHFLYPVVVTLVMILFFKDKASLPVIVATLLAIFGVYMLSNSSGGGSVNLRGLLYVLLTVFTYGLYIVGVNKSSVHLMDGLKMTFYVLLSCVIIFSANLLIKGNGLDLAPNFGVWSNLVLLAIIPTLISDLTLILSVQNVGSTTTAVLGCMEPLTAVVMGVFFLSEHFALLQLVGMIVIFIAVIIIILANTLAVQPSEVTVKENE